MGKNKKRSGTPDESQLFLRAVEASTEPIVDTHTHLLSTFSAYRDKYKEGKFESVYDFVRGAYESKNVKAMVDVYCEAPVQSRWRELADSAITLESREEKWDGIDYWFVMGVHPHESKDYTDEVEAEIFEAMKHPRNVGWGEIGLDYHYNLSPPGIQREVFTRQLKHAVRLGKPLTIHTREAEEDTEGILKEFVPIDYKFAKKLLDHFPNLHIGITGVITYSTNLNTANVIRNLCTPADSSSSNRLRILLETDAPYMVPGNIYKAFPELKSGSRFAISHAAMIPWTADFIANVAKESGADYDRERVMREARDNARKVYGI